MGEIGKLIPGLLLLTAIVAMSALLLVPSFVSAVAGEGNAMCICDFLPETQPPPCPTVPCQESANGQTCMGMCIAPQVCQAIPATCTKGGGGGMPMLPMLPMPMPKMPMPMMPSDQGPKDPPPCVENPATKTKSPTPCKEKDGTINYGDGTDISGFGDSGIGLGGDSSVGDILLNALGGTVSSSDDGDSGSDADAQDVETSGSAEQGENANQPTTPGAGANFDPKNLEGDIQVGVSGGTIFARSRDPISNSEVAGFFGGNSFNANASRSLVGRICVSRPWAGGTLGSFIPPSFFDGLCKRAGYQVGVSPVQSNTSAGPKRGSIIIGQPESERVDAPVQIAEPEVDIWAEPASVRLGTRTYIFWTSKGVLSCEETGPSFSQKGVSGGASTVPLFGASTFKIVCETSAGTVEDSVTVHLAI